MIDRLIRDLGANYNEEDKPLLEDIIEETSITALNIANRRDTSDNRNLLRSEIMRACKGLYLIRGAEGLNSLSESGRTSSFSDIMEQLRNDIIRNGKRVFK